MLNIYSLTKPRPFFSPLAPGWDRQLVRWPVKMVSTTCETWKWPTSYHKPHRHYRQPVHEAWWVVWEWLKQDKPNKLATPLLVWRTRMTLEASYFFWPLLSVKSAAKGSSYALCRVRLEYKPSLQLLCPPCFCFVKLKAEGGMRLRSWHVRDTKNILNIPISFIKCW